ncbi:MAG: T9SS type A sorting domain-containing protein [Bacteroidales bacterium]|jgi:hypothetical protein|nr:T9SS type A sorting domain-containing protein [Bacteroidales bacterium]
MPITAVRRLFFLFITIFLFAPVICAQTPDKWQERRDAEKGKNPYINCIIEYKPAPGQFINIPGIGTSEAAESIVGGTSGMVSLGNFGGYIIVGFDHTIWNDPDNPYGVDFTVIGNAVSNSSEPGIVMVMKDENGNGLPDDTWYELKGSSYDSLSTIHHYSITYYNPLQPADVPWTDSERITGFVKTVPAHSQAYYPSIDNFPEYPGDEVTFSGTLVSLDINDSNPQFVRIKPLAYGYADNRPFTNMGPPYLPDNPKTFDLLEGSGGNAFDIDWAVDEHGNPVELEGIDFIKIYTAVNINAGWLGEISTEVCGIIDVSPDDITSASSSKYMPVIQIYPNPANEYIHIQSPDNKLITHIEIWDVSGKTMYHHLPAKDDLSISVSDYPDGIYIIRIMIEGKQVTRKFVVHKN